MNRSKASSGVQWIRRELYRGIHWRRWFADQEHLGTGKASGSQTKGKGCTRETNRRYNISVIAPIFTGRRTKHRLKIQLRAPATSNRARCHRVTRYESIDAPMCAATTRIPIPEIAVISTIPLNLDGTWFNLSYFPRLIIQLIWRTSFR